MRGFFFALPKSGEIRVRVVAQKFIVFSSLTPCAEMAVSLCSGPMQHPLSRNWPKYLIGWAFCFALRLLPYRPANLEPVMAATMPFGKVFGLFAGFVFGFLSIVLYDVATNLVGIWTLVTAMSYGLVGLAAGLYFRNRKGSVTNYVLFAILATIAYDLVTGVLMGPVLFGGSMREAFLGQIPFTLQHLLGNVILAAVVSPLLERWVLTNERLEIWPGRKTAL